MEEDEVDVLGDFCLNLETDLNHYDAGEFPSQNSELLGDYMQHPWLLDSSQTWYNFDHATEDKNKVLVESMLHEERKHFPSPASGVQPQTVNHNQPKVSSLWTKEDVESLRKGIELHSSNWGKVARLVGTKTTLQVKSYIKSHPELMASPYPLSGTPSPPQFIHEVEVSQEESSLAVPVHQVFSVEDIVNEAEIPASMEEVVSVATSYSDESWAPLKMTSTIKKKNKVELPLRTKSFPKLQRREKSSLIAKRGPGRPRKISQAKEPLPPAVSVLSNPNEDTILPVLPKAPVLLGEIVRLQRPSETASDSKSDSEEVDIDCSDDESERQQRLMLSRPVIKTEEIPLVVEVKPDVSECESQSETDTKAPENPIPQQQQPVFTFPAPEAERTIDLAVVTEEEKTVHWDFFAGEGNSAKTPERYIKIRNSIFQEWRRVRPRYLTKTSVRPSLKNCGDVNCISRVHAYLELTGAINFGCEQVQYGRPLPPVPSHRERLASCNGGLQHPFASILPIPGGSAPRARVKKRPVDHTDLSDGGYTISHDGEIIDNRHHSLPKPKMKRKTKESDNTDTSPFRLVDLVPFGGDKPAPFRIELSVEALLIVDLHAHLCKTEVIGLLGGRFDTCNGPMKTLRIEAAQPCRSQSTSHQCEMCPVSQTEGSEELRSRGLEVVGWYHSHPTFKALPSVRDVHTQTEFQEWFSRQEAPFIGLIVNPFPSPETLKTSSSAVLKSVIRCLTVHDDRPYKHELSICNNSKDIQLDRVRETLDLLEATLDPCPTLVPLNGKYPCRFGGAEDAETLTYARKAVLSILGHLDKVDALSSDTLDDIEQLSSSFLERLILRSIQGTDSLD